MAIIGVSGKIGSGKDTLGNVIQYLSCNSEEHFKEDIEMGTLEGEMKEAPEFSEWKIKKFADKLKECVSIITGISRKDLEKIEVKNSTLGEEWIRYGYADTFYRDMDGKPIMNNKQCTKEEYLEHYKTNWQTAYKHEYTVRELLQLFGTEVGRQIHSDFWINALFADYKLIDHRTMQDPDDSNITYPSWIITDLRFPNELKAIEDRGGITIRVNRNLFTFKCDYCTYEVTETQAFYDSICPMCKKGNIISKPKSNHLSETALDNATFDYTIENNGKIEDLIVKMREIMINEKIL